MHSFVKALEQKGYITVMRVRYEERGPGARICYFADSVCTKDGGAEKTERDVSFLFMKERIND